jgi:hypothetical protein
LLVPCVLIFGFIRRISSVALRDLANAYALGGDAIQNAQIEQKLLGEKKAMDDARSELDRYTAKYGEAGSDVDAFRKKPGNDEGLPGVCGRFEGRRGVEVEHEAG